MAAQLKCQEAHSMLECSAAECAIEVSNLVMVADETSCTRQEVSAVNGSYVAKIEDEMLLGDDILRRNLEESRDILNTEKSDGVQGTLNTTSYSWRAKVANQGVSSEYLNDTRDVRADLRLLPRSV